MPFSFANVGEIHELPSGEIHSSRELRSRVQARATQLRAAGLNEGDSALICHGSSAAFFVDLFAVWELGACAAPVDPQLTPRELTALINQTDCSLVLYGDRLEARRRARSDAAGGALLLFTSGTSALPKGVLHSLDGIASRLKAWESHIPLGHVERTLCFLPTHFGHGLLGNCLYPLLNGASLYLLPAFGGRSIAALDELIDANQITFFSTVPSVWESALRLSGRSRGGSLKRVHCASAPLSRRLWGEIREWCGSAEIKNVYGMTELASWVAGSDDGANPHEDGFVGKPWGASIDIRGGEVWFKADSMMLGYYRDEAQTREVLHEGWLKTGDLGHLDADGNLILTGRTKTQINKAGIKVSPEELDLILLSHPLVSEVCAFGLPDVLAGEAVACAVVFAPGASPDRFDDLETWCRERLAPHKVPSRWFELPAIPRTSRGKTDRNRVAELCRKGAEHESSKD